MTPTAYAKTLVLVAVVLFLTLPADGGIWFCLVLLLFMPWALYNLVRLGTKPAERRPHVIRLAIWIVALVAAGATQVHWTNAAREQANAAAQSLLAYKVRTGSYPASLAEAGLDEHALSSEWRLRYRLREGKPELRYPASLMPLTEYGYDFEARRWKTNAY